MIANASAAACSLLAALTIAPTPAFAGDGLPKGSVRIPSSTSATVEYKKPVVKITGPGCGKSHVTGLVLKASPKANTFVLNKGIYTRLKFKGHKGSDKLVLQPSAVVITKVRNGGLNVNFGDDDVKDVFVFKNTINVERQSKIWGRPISPFNHLQRVVIRNFGRQDKIVLQGKTYTYHDVNKYGALPGISPLHIKVIRR